MPDLALLDKPLDGDTGLLCEAVAAAIVELVCVEVAATVGLACVDAAADSCKLGVRRVRISRSVVCHTIGIPSHNTDNLEVATVLLTSGFKSVV